jgi:16S rRNA (cytosine1402-N4)-methyltransferase
VSEKYGHKSVLLAEAVKLLAPQPGDTVLDVTLGLGGHSEAFLREIGPTGQLIAIDADTDNIRTAQARLSPYKNQLDIHHRNFKTIGEIMPLSVDVVFADLGLSSPHIDDVSRGFTFRQSAPLDLRYDRTSGQTAAQFLSEASEDDILSVLRTYGEVDKAKQLAKELKEKFQARGSDGKTDDVKSVVEKLFGYKAPSVLPQIFQALRIAVNDELGAVSILLDVLPEIVKPGGRIGIISYHSLEDRLVKNAFKELCSVPKNEITGQDIGKPSWELVTKKPVCPSEAELIENPRSRSAKFRVLRRLAE